jgi:ribonucleoside-diphosphate reductase alpha chain
MNTDSDAHLEEPSEVEANMEPLTVIKRDGRIEEVHFDKITVRIQNCINMNPPLNPIVSASRVAQAVIRSLKPGIHTWELDEEAARICHTLITTHTDYDVLAARIAISNHQKRTPGTFLEAVSLLRNVIDKSSKTTKQLDEQTGKVIEQTESRDIISDSVYALAVKYADQIEKRIDYKRDYLFGYFGFETVKRQGYLIRIYEQDHTGQWRPRVIERPQHLYMRVALGMYGENLEAAFTHYDLLSLHYMTNASPTLFNMGTRNGQGSSCFLMSIGDDTLQEIYKTLGDCAMLSKHCGGIGVTVTNIRGRNSIIKSTNGLSNGICPMLRVFNETARYVDQGGGKRKGSIAVYLEPWHRDIREFLFMKTNRATETFTERAIDLFYALWIPDLFMERIWEGGKWSLFSPDDTPDLIDLVGDEFKQRYEYYERCGYARETLDAHTFWFQILSQMFAQGMPYILFKDTCNKLCNQKNVGVVHGSNLCSEIVQVHNSKNIASCNLSTIAVNKCITTDENGHLVYDHQKLFEVARLTCRGLNQVIENNYYFLKEVEECNFNMRPIGVGIQGLANTFFQMRLPYGCPESIQLQTEIFETIYYGCIYESCELAKVHGPYPAFKGSPYSVGKLHHDLFAEYFPDVKVHISGRWNWDALRNDVVTYGVRNSLVCTVPPTATTSQMLGNVESFEPLNSNIYNREVLGGVFLVVNQSLVHDLMKIGMWNKNIKDLILLHDGSIQNIPGIPDDLKMLYRTVWEIPTKDYLDMGIQRTPWIDQSTSFNNFIAKDISDPIGKLNTSLFYAWRGGMKTGCYYLRTKSRAKALQFTLDPQLQVQNNININNTVDRSEPVEQESKEEVLFCTRDNPDCTFCSS